ncbi:hypothetical protein T484DRAFT_1850381, partial [Baffinella frigidus]
VGEKRGAEAARRERETTLTRLLADVMKKVDKLSREGKPDACLKQIDGVRWVLEQQAAKTSAQATARHSSSGLASEPDDDHDSSESAPGKESVTEVGKAIGKTGLGGGWKKLRRGSVAETRHTVVDMQFLEVANDFLEQLEEKECPLRRQRALKLIEKCGFLCSTDDPSKLEAAMLQASHVLERAEADFTIANRGSLCANPWAFDGDSFRIKLLADAFDADTLRDNRSKVAGLSHAANLWTTAHAMHPERDFDAKTNSLADAQMLAAKFAVKVHDSDVISLLELSIKNELAVLRATRRWQPEVLKVVDEADRLWEIEADNLVRVRRRVDMLTPSIQPREVREELAAEISKIETAFTQVENARTDATFIDTRFK